ncbi:hypothetical protein HK102_003211 [Quaeritorhiza haematococci]|nr:hypothetical protein HK102_003211 [Quaeritorhiza haematococci]
MEQPLLSPPAAPVERSQKKLTMLDPSALHIVSALLQSILRELSQQHTSTTTTTTLPPQQPQQPAEDQNAKHHRTQEHHEEESEQDTPLVRALCHMWDSTAVHEYAYATTKLQGHRLLLEILSSTTSPRILEVCFGTLANIVSFQSCRDTIFGFGEGGDEEEGEGEGEGEGEKEERDDRIEAAENEEPELRLKLLSLACQHLNSTSDPLILSEILRFLQSILHACKSPSPSTLSIINTLPSHNVAQLLFFFLVNTLNETLFNRIIETLRTLVPFMVRVSSPTIPDEDKQESPCQYRIDAEDINTLLHGISARLDATKTPTPPAVSTLKDALQLLILLEDFITANLLDPPALHQMKDSVCDYLTHMSALHTSHAADNADSFGSFDDDLEELIEEGMEIASEVSAIIDSALKDFEFEHQTTA